VRKELLDSWRQGKDGRSSAIDVRRGEARRGRREGRIDLDEAVSGSGDLERGIMAKIVRSKGLSRERGSRVEEEGDGGWA
jgi:hypothetical protein